MDKATGGAQRYAALYRRYGMNVTFDDCLSAAYAGLVVAARQYDPTRGTTFYTYAFNWMNAHLRNIGRVERRQTGWAYHPTTTELRDDKRGMQRVVQFTEWPQTEDGENVELPAASEDIEAGIARREQHALVLASAKTPRHRAVLAGRLDGKTSSAIAGELGVTRQWVEYLEIQAVASAKRYVAKALAAQTGTGITR